MPQVGLFRQLAELRAPEGCRLSDVEDGVSRPRKLTLGPGETPDAYIVKTPSRCEDPMWVLNEAVCWRLATYLGLPVLDAYCLYAALDGSEERHFALPWVDMDATADVDPTKIDGADCVEALLVFDLFIANADRGTRNSKVLRSRTDPNRYELVVIDHTHTLTSAFVRKVSFSARAEYVTCEYLQGHLGRLRPDRLRAAAEALLGLSSTDLTSLVYDQPFGTEDERGATAKWFFERPRLLPRLMLGNFGKEAVP
jgi:hypothetical protein